MELAGVVLGSLKTGLPLNICEAMRGCASAWCVPSYCMYGVAVRLLVTTGVRMGVSVMESSFLSLSLSSSVQAQAYLSKVDVSGRE